MLGEVISAESYNWVPALGLEVVFPTWMGLALVVCFYDLRYWYVGYLYARYYLSEKDSMPKCIRLPDAIYDGYVRYCDLK